MRSAALLTASVLLLLSGCGTDTARTGAAEAVPVEVIGTGKQADYAFSAATLDGTVLDGSSLEGRPAVLWFWAPWCPTCRAQSPNVSALAEQYDGEVAVVGVGGLDDAAAISDLAADIPHVTHIVDEEGQVWRHFRVTAQSTYTVIDAEGEIIVERYLDDAELNDLVARLAAESS